MQNTGKQIQPSKDALRKIKAELQELHPQLKRVKVKAHPHENRVRAFAFIGKRRVYVRGQITEIISRFTEQFLERLPSAF